MSSGAAGTRDRILSAARELLQQSPGVTVSMGEVAQRAGVSRQALYLHFADRTTLLVEVARQVDASVRTPARQRRIDSAETARAALREAVALQAWLKPRIHAVATALDVLRHTDPAAEAAWNEREQARLNRCEEVVQRLAADGALAERWTVDEAARMLWAVTSLRVWDDLVGWLGWSQARYRDHVTALLESSLLRTPPAS